MTDKRFISNYDGSEIIDRKGSIAYAFHSGAEEPVIELLNRLNDENKELKEIIVFQRDTIKRDNKWENKAIGEINELRKENEQLKQSLENKMNSDNYWEQKATEKIKELEEENEQLKQSMDNLFNYFSKWFEDERGIYIEEFSEMWNTIKNRRK